MKEFETIGYLNTSIEYDATEERFILGSHQNVKPILDDVNARNNDGTGGYSKSRDLQLAARIPCALYDEWMRQAFVQGIPVYHKRERDVYIKKKLSDHDRLKVGSKTPGRI